MAKIYKDEIDRLFDYDIYVPTRTIVMRSHAVDNEDGESGTDAEMAQRIIKGLHILDSSAPNGDKPITIIMNNPGGDEYDGLGIYDAIKACRNHITIIVYGKAMSMGGIILQAADKRVMSANSRFMMHYGSFGSDGNAQDVYKWIDDNKKIDSWMEDLFLEKMQAVNPSLTKKDIQEMLKSDFIVTGEEAVELGLADEVLE
jgi:ATP-dependent Clp protease protease subunit